MAGVQKIEFGPSKLPGYEVGDKSAPAVIVMQEWWGVTEVIKKQAALLAEKGFRCLIPDLYKGKLGVDAEEAAHMMNNLDFQGAVKEVGEAAQYLKETGSPKVGITGFCMGGALTFAAAQHIPGLAVGVPCYGIPDARYFQIEQIKIPLLLISGGKDGHKGFSDPESVSAAIEKIKAAGGSIESHVAPGAPHGFLNAIVGEEGIELVKKVNGFAAPEDETKAAWEALSGFLAKHLK